MEFWTKVISFVASFNCGVSLVNLPEEIIEKYAELTGFDLKEDSNIETVLETSYCVGCAVGCMVTPLYAKKLGFDKTLRMLFIGFIVVCLATIIPIHWLYLTGMQFLTGFTALSIGTLTPLVVAENLDAEQRGKTMMVYAISLNVGICEHYLISFEYAL